MSNGSAGDSARVDASAEFEGGAYCGHDGVCAVEFQVMTIAIHRFQAGAVSAQEIINTELAKLSRGPAQSLLLRVEEMQPSD